MTCFSLDDSAEGLALKILTGLGYIACVSSSAVVTQEEFKPSSGPVMYLLCIRSLNS